MKQTTNLFLFFILFIMTIVFLILPVQAVVYEGLVTTPMGLGFYGMDTILVSEGSSPSELYRFYLDGAGSGSVNIVNISNYIEDACVGKDGYIYFVLTDGKVYEFSGGGGYYDFSLDYTDNFLLLGGMATDYVTKQSIVCDSNGNIYSNSGQDVYVFSYPTYSMSIYKNCNIGYGQDRMSIETLGLHEDGLLVGLSAYNLLSTPSVQLIYSNLTMVSLFTDSEVSDVDIRGVYSTENKDVYFCRNDNLHRLNYSNGYEKTTISTLSAIPSDCVIDDGGIIYLSMQAANTICTYSTVDLQGGYSFIGYTGSTGSQQLEYDTSTLNSLYTAYNNDSTVELMYIIDIDLVDGLTTQDFYDSNSISQYYWIVDILDENGIKQKSSIINTFKKDYSITSGWHILSVGNLHYSASPWTAGNWSAILYEYDKTTGLRAFLDSCTYTISDSVSDTTITDDTPIIDPNLDPVNRITALLESNAFIGLLVMIACIGAFGKIGGVTGVVLGTVAGVSLSYLLGYIPAWVLFLMVLALCIVFVSKLINGFGGNSS